MNEWTFGVMTDHKPHIEKIEANGWLNTPGSATVSCSCGWSGLKLIEAWHTAKDPSSSFSEPYKSFVAKWGVEQLLQAGSEAYVEATKLDDLMKLQVLQHLAYKPTEDKDQAMARFKLASNKFIDAFSKTEVEFDAVSAELNKAKKEVTRAYKRNEIWVSMELPVVVPLKPEAQKELKKLQHEQEVENSKDFGKPLTPEEEELLGLSRE